MEKHFCPYCMTPVPENESCPVCGLTAGTYVPSPYHLPPGTTLQDRYLIGRVLGEGGFGITYIGCDLQLEMKVAVKEYYPRDRATRNTSASMEVNSFVGRNAQSFQRGMQKFLGEARVMARLVKQPVIVRVHDFFEANGTAYIVMEYVEGTTFRELVEQQGGRIAPGELFSMIRPLFPALSIMHESNLIHRDISPDNLMLESGNVRLLDFGCAKDTEPGNETMTITLKHGYAPPEQYRHNGQGPCTDIYALCGTIYFCLTGKTPPSSLERILNDELLLPTKLGVPLTDKQEAALMRGLALSDKERFQSVKELQAALYDTETPDDAKDVDLPTEEDKSQKDVPLTDSAVTFPQTETAADTKSKTDVPDQDSSPLSDARKPKTSGRKWGLIVGVVAVLAVLAIVFFHGSESSLPVTPASQDAEAALQDYTITEDIFAPDLQKLMDDPGIGRVILEAGNRIYIREGEAVVTKPLVIRSGADLDVETSLTVTESGQIQLYGAGSFNGLIRLEGEGTRLSMNEGSYLYMENGFTTVWMESDDNLTNEGGTLEWEEQHKILANEEQLLSEAVHASTWEEVKDAVASNTPVVVEADMTYEEELVISSPFIVKENVTLSAPSEEAPALNLTGKDSIFINHGTVLGHLTLDDGSSVINFGELGANGNRWNIYTNSCQIINYGTVHTDGDVWLHQGMIYNVGTFYAQFFVDKGTFTNQGEVIITDEGLLEITGNVPFSNYGSVTVEGGGTMQNYGLFSNSEAGQVLFQSGANLENCVLDNSGEVRMEEGVNLDTKGSVFFGNGSFDMGDSAQKVYSTSGSAWWESTTVQQEEQLRAALEDDSVPSILLDGDVTLDSDLRVTKDLFIQGTLTMSGDAVFSAEHAQVILMTERASLKGSHFTFSDDSYLNTEENGATITVNEGGELNMDSSFFFDMYRGQLQLNGAQLNLTNKAVFYLTNGLAPSGLFDKASITVQDDSVFLPIKEYSEVNLTVRNATVSCPNSVDWNTCDITLEEGGLFRIFSDDSVRLNGGTWTIAEGAVLASRYCSLDIRGGCQITNLGEFSVEGWGDLYMDGDCQFTNLGRFDLNTGNTIQGEVDNQGEVYYNSSEHDLGVNAIKGNPPIDTAE